MRWGINSGDLKSRVNCRTRTFFARGLLRLKSLTFRSLKLGNWRTDPCRSFIRPKGARVASNFRCGAVAVNPPATNVMPRHKLKLTAEFAFERVVAEAQVLSKLVFQQTQFRMHLLRRGRLHRSASLVTVDYPGKRRLFAAAVPNRANQNSPTGWIAPAKLRS